MSTEKSAIEITADPILIEQAMAVFREVQGMEFEPQYGNELLTILVQQHKQRKTIEGALTLEFCDRCDFATNSQIEMLKHIQAHKRE